MASWPEIQFGSLVRQRREIVKPDQQQRDMPYLGLEHFNLGGGLSGQGLASDATGDKFRFGPGDTLYGRLRPYFRKTLRASFEGYCSTEIWVLEPVDDSVLLPDFLAYLVLDQSFTDFAMQGAQGTKMPRASWEHVSRFKVSLPSLEEQQAIVDVLRTFDELIANNDVLIDSLRDAALAKYALTCQSTTSTVPLGEVVNVNPSQIKRNTVGSLTYLDITSVGDDKITWPDKMAWAEAPSRARRLARKGDTIWSTVRPNRRAHALLTQVPDDLVVSTGFAVLQPHKIGPAETFCATHGPTFVDFLMSRADGSAYPAVRPDGFAAAPIAALSSEVSRDFEAVAWPLLESAGVLAAENLEMVATRNAILPQLLTKTVVPERPAND
jgi:type I restriction enzyme, S subunit